MYKRQIDVIATRQFLTPDWKPTVIDFDDLKTKKDVDEMFALYPDKAAKVLVRVTGEMP